MEAFPSTTNRRKLQFPAQGYHCLTRSTSKDVFTIIRPKPDRLYLQVMPGSNKTYGFAFGSHEDRVGDCRDAAARPHAGEKRAVADAGRAENDVLTIRQIVRRIYAIEISFMAVGDQAFSLLVVAWPHSALHVAAEAFDRSRREHCLGRTTDAHVKIDVRLGQRRR